MHPSGFVIALTIFFHTQCLYSFVVSDDSLRSQMNQEMTLNLKVFFTLPDLKNSQKNHAKIRF